MNLFACKCDSLLIVLRDTIIKTKYQPLYKYSFAVNLLLAYQLDIGILKTYDTTCLIRYKLETESIKGNDEHFLAPALTKNGSRPTKKSSENIVYSTMTCNSQELQQLGLNHCSDDCNYFFIDEHDTWLPHFNICNGACI